MPESSLPKRTASPRKYLPSSTTTVTRPGGSDLSATAARTAFFAASNVPNGADSVPSPPFAPGLR